MGTEAHRGAEYLSPQSAMPYLEIAATLRAFAAAASSASTRAEFTVLAAQYERLGHRVINGAVSPLAQPVRPRAAVAIGIRRRV